MTSCLRYIRELLMSGLLSICDNTTDHEYNNVMKLIIKGKRNILKEHIKWAGGEEEWKEFLMKCLEQF